MFASSRMFPGQACRVSATMASSLHAGHRLTRPHAVQRGEVPHERRNVARSLAQRRDRDRNHVEPKQQIVAKRAVGRRPAPRSLFVADTMRTSTRIGFPPPTRSISLRLDGAEQLGLRLGAEVADFVEKERAAVRELEPPDAPVGRAGERAALVAEHLALHQIARNRRAIHAHERTVAPRARRVNRRRDELLARARFAGDQHA